ncbi:MAG: hypothetical protein HS126_33525 [Anaerolineales bacterium]|nr:hypothetical protein [Anaerolineales bacterium]
MGQVEQPGRTADKAERAEARWFGFEIYQFFRITGNQITRSTPTDCVYSPLAPSTEPTSTTFVIVPLKSGATMTPTCSVQTPPKAGILAVNITI